MHLRAHKKRICCFSLYFFIGLLCAGAALSTKAFSRERTVGWHHALPYQHIKEGKDGVVHLTGLDIEFLRAMAKEMGISFQYVPTPRTQHPLNIQGGTTDLVAGLTNSDPGLSPHVYYSEPYRYESSSVLFLKQSPKRFAFEGMEDFIEKAKAYHLCLGVVEGEGHLLGDLEAFLEDPNPQVILKKFKTLEEATGALLHGQIDGLLAERLSAITTLWKEGCTNQIVEFPLGEAVPIRVALSRQQFSPTDVEDFNKALHKIKDSGQFQRIFSKYLHPLLLLQTLNSPWFFALELIGTIAFAISGLILAFRDRVTFFGAMVYAFLPSMGGGVLRDILVAREKLGVVLSPIYLLVIISTVLVGFLVTKAGGRLSQKTHQKWGPFFSALLVVTDSIGLGTFVVIGVVVAVIMDLEPLWLWGPTLAFLTGAGGGILRDMVRKIGRISCFHNEIYAEVAIFWGLLLSLYMAWDANSVNTTHILIAVYITIVGTVFTRLWCYYKKVPNIHFGPRTYISE